MPIEVRELIVRANVRGNESQSNDQNNTRQRNNCDPSESERQMAERLQQMMRQRNER